MPTDKPYSPCLPEMPGEEPDDALTLHRCPQCGEVYLGDSCPECTVTAEYPALQRQEPLTGRQDQRDTDEAPAVTALLAGQMVLL